MAPFLKIENIHFNGVNELLTTSLSLEKGEQLKIVGPNLSGKTNAAYTIAGLVKGNATIFMNDQQITSQLDFSRHFGLIPSDPTHIFSRLSQTLLGEIELSFNFLGTKMQQVQVDEIVDLLGISKLLESNPLSLSGGEKVKASLAVVLAKNPQILIIDEVFKHLDSSSRKQVQEAIERFRISRNISIIEFQSFVNIEDPKTNISNILFITKGGLIRGSLHENWNALSSHAPELLPNLAYLAAELTKEFKIKYTDFPTSIEMVAAPLKEKFSNINIIHKNNVHRKIAIEIEDLCFSYENQNRFNLGPIHHKFYESDVVAILGKNGTGKTTFMKCLANIINNWKGSIRVNNDILAKNTALCDWSAYVRYCFQNPDDQLYLPTTKEELLSNNYSNSNSSNLFNEIVEIFKLKKYLNQSPLDLPRSVKRLVTLASSFITQPPVLLLDEPTALLDRNQIKTVIKAINHYKSRNGLIIMVSHDIDFVEEVATNILIMDQGQIINSDPTTNTYILDCYNVCLVSQVANSLGLKNGIYSRELLKSHFLNS